MWFLLVVLAVPSEGMMLSCESYNISHTRAWIDAQGCQNLTVNDCAGLPPEAGCTDAVYIARALAAGGVLPLDPNDSSRAAYQKFAFGGRVYNLELSADLKSVLKVLGWAPNGTPAKEAAAGDVIFTNAFSDGEGGMPCYAYGGGLFMCHESPLLFGPNCGIRADVMSCCDPQTWSCAGAPRPPPTPPPPAPPVPPACHNQVCYPDPSAAYICGVKPGADADKLQDGLDYACGDGSGVDCAPINHNGACVGIVNDTLVDKANWAFDAFYKVQCPFCITPVAERCDFGGTAMLTRGPFKCP